MFYSRCRSIIAALLLSALASVHAATFVVVNTDDSGLGSLRQAITEANNAPAEDIIMFDVVGPGPHTLNLTSALPPLTGNVQILNDAVGSEMVTVQRSHSAGTPDFRIFTVMPGSNVLLGGVTIANGYLPNEPGGAIWSKNAELTIRSCTLISNGSGSVGGAVYNAGVNGIGHVSFSNCKLIGNNSGSGGGNPSGGAIYNVSIFDFFAPDPNAPRRAIMTLTNCTLSGNSADFGGAISQAVGGGGAGDLTLSNCIVANNTSRFGGGGLYNRLSSGGNAVATVHVESCTFSSNIVSSLGWGGAISNLNGEVFARNSTFSGNSAEGGGGLNNNTTSPDDFAQLMVQNCTIAANHASSDGGGGLRHTGANGSVKFQNTIVAGNTSSSSARDLKGAFISQGHNLIANSAGSTGFANGANNDSVGGGGNPVLDARLASLMDNGGPTHTHALLSDSPAINSGNDGFAPPTDQRGYFRLGISDKGAFEFGGLEVRIINIARSGSDIVVTLQAIAQRTFRLERKLNITDPGWNSISGVSDLSASTTGPAQITDPDAITLGNAFYRVRLLP